MLIPTIVIELLAVELLTGLEAVNNGDAERFAGQQGFNDPSQQNRSRACCQDI